LIAQGNNVKGHNTVRHEHVWLALERNQAVINIKIIDIKLCMSLIEIQSKMTTLLCSQAIVYGRKMDTVQSHKLLKSIELKSQNTKKKFHACLKRNNSLSLNT